MGLKTYRSKRKVKESHEPKGKKRTVKKQKALSFVVQKHHARRLHYDFRLEMDGVLKSWAIPKGPSLDPSIKRLAVQVEDHPLEYGKFAGTIPKGHYGAGKVEIWDKGTYISAYDEDQGEKVLKKQLAKGELKIILSGKKLKGEFVLVRLKKGDEKNQWLLIKAKDQHSSEEDITENEPSSNIDKILETPVVKSAKMPHHISPMLSTLIKEPFDDPDWIFEIKWDGYRAVAEVSSKIVELYSRDGNSFKTQFPPIVQSLQKIKGNLILDGEVVVLDSKGLPSFQLLQQFLKSGDGNIRYYVFDLLYLEGRDLRSLPLLERKELLEKVLEKNSDPLIIYCDHIDEQGKRFFKEAGKLGLEGIMAKKKDSVYSTKRSKDWLKIKTHKSQEAVIVGYTEPRGGRKKFGSLLLGVYQNSSLQFVGHVGTGFNDKALVDIYKKLQPLVTHKCPLKEIPKTHTSAVWVKPKLVCEVYFTEWTQDQRMRHPVFKGLRTDKSAKEVVMEKEKRKTKVTKSQKKKKSSEDFISNRDKIFWKKEKYTKGDLLDYYSTISSYILPYLKDRPQVMHRFPDGINGEGFYQKEAPDFIPEWMETAPVQHTEKVINYMMISDRQSLLYVVNLACIELHPFLSKVDNIDNPDFIVLDLDPESISFKKVVQVALEAHEILDELGVPNYCKTSGKRGIHIYVPLGGKYTYEQAQNFAELLARAIHNSVPQITSLIRNPKKRQKKVYIDYLQNSRTKTIASPYSVRPAPGASVSTPLEWSEVNEDLDPKDFNIKTIPERLKSKGDPFKKMLKQKINLKSILGKLDKYIEAE